MTKFEVGYLWSSVPATLVQFLGWAFTGRVVPYGSGWTAPRYLRAWDEWRAEMERQSARARPRQWTPEEINAARNAARHQAARAEKIARRTHCRWGRGLARANRPAAGGSAGYCLARP